MYLTKDEKQKRTAEWVEKRERFKSYGLRADEDTAGTGYPDPAIYELTDRLNKLEGICTVQSCSGHPRLGGDAKRKWSAPGQLWLRLDKHMFDRFIHHAQKFVGYEEIEEVVIRWGREREGPIVEINFKGLDVSVVSLSKSSDLIVEWMEGLT